MALSNAERQARYQRRVKERLTQCVTPEDVVEAARIVHEIERKRWPEAGEPPFEAWVAGLTDALRFNKWAGRLPTVRDDYSDLTEFSDYLDEDQIALLKRVAAVVHAVRVPPSEG